MGGTNYTNRLNAMLGFMHTEESPGWCAVSARPLVLSVYTGDEKALISELLRELAIFPDYREVI